LTEKEFKTKLYEIRDNFLLKITMTMSEWDVKSFLELPGDVQEELVKEGLDNGAFEQNAAGTITVCQQNAILLVD
jgi:hypothetical protein